MKNKTDTILTDKVLEVLPIQDTQGLMFVQTDQAPVSLTKDEYQIRMQALTLGMQIYDLMFKMNVLDIPKNLAELHALEAKTNQTLLDSVLKDMYEISKRNWEFITNQKEEEIETHLENE